MDINQLKKFGTMKTYKRAEVLFRAGDSNECLYMVLSGGISLREKIGDNFKTEILRSGKFFGELSMILNIPITQTCIIEENETVILSIPASRLEGYMDADKGFCLRVMKNMGSRIRELVGENEKLQIELRKHLPASDDIQLGKSPESEEPITEEKEEPPIEVVKPVIVPAKVSLEMPNALKNLMGLGMVPPNHGIYESRQWSDATKAISPKTITCPVCDEKFVATYMSKSRLGVGKTMPDMRKIYTDIDPIYFDVYSCHHCGYSNYTSDFMKIEKPGIEHLKTVLPRIGKLPLDFEEDIFNINYIFLKLYLTIFCNVEIRCNAVAVPKTWMRLSWLYEDMGESILSEFSTKEAYNQYSNAYYNTKTFSGESEVELMLLMGEIALKLGDEKNAANHFLTALQNLGINNLQRSKAEDRMYELRHKKDEAGGQQQNEAMD